MNPLLVAAMDYVGRGWSVIPIGKDKKPPAKLRWKPYQTRLATPDELAVWFARRDVSGLAVLCGDVSGGLVVRDFDDADACKRWCAEHPDVAKMLPMVKTARGWHLYFRCPGARTVTCEDGELRAAGAYILAPPSMHPSGIRYRFVTPLPVGDLPIIDPEQVGLIPSVLRIATDRTDTTDQTERTESVLGESQARREVAPPPSPLIYSVVFDSALLATIPTGPGKRHRQVFNFARALKARMPDAAPMDLKPWLREWHRRALPIIRTKEFEETMSDFLRAWPRIDPAFGPATVDAAFERAKGRAPLPELAEYGPRVHLLANLCRELQAATGDAPFFLAARTAGKLLECDPTPAWRVLDLLEEEKMLECVEEGTPGRAARYRWIGPTN